MHKPSRRKITPVLVHNAFNEDAEIEPLERVPFKEKALNEAWLQRLIFAQPELLAVNEIEPDYTPLIPLAREVGNAAGSIDALYISPTGLITLVETKLWKNAQARREVVAQILDYAQYLADWSYDDLDERVRQANGNSSVWDTVQQAVGQKALDEDEFVDAVNRNLARGRFLLLIAGDGIQSRVHDMADYLQVRPDMRFTLALVELGLYRGNTDGDLLVVPNVVMRTREVVRAVVDVNNTNANIDIAAPIASSSAARVTGRTRSQKSIDDEDFLDRIRRTDPSGHALAWVQAFLREAERRPVLIENMTSSKIVKLEDPAGTGQKFSLMTITENAEFGVGMLSTQMSRAGREWVGSPADKLLEELTQLFGTTLVPTDKHSRHPDCWKPRANLATTAVTPSQAIGLLDRYLHDMRLEAEHAVAGD